jgi:hypothetical protein
MSKFGLKSGADLRAEPTSEFIQIEIAGIRSEGCHDDVGNLSKSCTAHLERSERRDSLFYGSKRKLPSNGTAGNLPLAAKLFSVVDEEDERNFPECFVEFYFVSECEMNIRNGTCQNPVRFALAWNPRG